MRNEIQNLPALAAASDRRAPIGGGDTSAQSLTTQPATGSSAVGYGLAAPQLRAELALPCHLFTDPYAWFEARGEHLAACSISIKPRARATGTLYSGQFNIAGFIYSVGAASIEQLCVEAMQKRCRHLQGIHSRQQRRRERSIQSYITRHPEADGLPHWLTA